MLLINHLHLHCHYHASFFATVFVVYPFFCSSFDSFSVFSSLFPFLILAFHNFLSLSSFSLFPSRSVFLLPPLCLSSFRSFIYFFLIFLILFTSSFFFIYYSFPYSFFHPSTLPSFLFFVSFVLFLLQYSLCFLSHPSNIQQNRTST